MHTSVELVRICLLHCAKSHSEVVIYFQYSCGLIGEELLLLNFLKHQFVFCEPPYLGKKCLIFVSSTLLQSKKQNMKIYFKLVDFTKSTWFVYNLKWYSTNELMMNTGNPRFPRFRFPQFLIYRGLWFYPIFLPFSTTK